MSYKKNYSTSINDPLKYWEKKANSIYWYKKWDSIFKTNESNTNLWFDGAKINTCYNCIDRHVEQGNGQKPAVIYDSPITNKKYTINYETLSEKVSSFAASLDFSKVKKGDRVIIYMPMIPEVIIAMLACARIGAIHSVVFGGFSAVELANRISDAKPKVIISASCGIEPNRVIDYKIILDKSIELSSYKPDKQIIFQRKEYECNLDKPGDEDWIDFEKKGPKNINCIPVDANDPLYILYTSGTTGIPKGIVRTNGGHAVALYNSMQMTYGITKDEVFWAASDVGWVVGHSYIVYAPLLFGCTTVLYEGKPVGTPDAGQFWRVISEHKVSCMFTAPTAIRAIKKEDPLAAEVKKYNLDHLKSIFLAGERADPETVKWSHKYLKVPIIDHWWQTETGWSIAGNFSSFNFFPTKYGSTGKAAPGYKVLVVDDKGKPLRKGNMGNLVIKLPLPPGCSSSIWNSKSRFFEAYLRKFPGYYDTSDAGIIDEDDYISVMSRTDDIINCAGHRISTGSIEEILTTHPDVAECAVVGIKDKLKGEVPYGLIVLNKNNLNSKHKVINETIKLVREKLGPVASYKISTVVESLPKTRSGKILRSTIAKILNKEDYDVPATIEDQAVLNFIKNIEI